MLHSTQPQYLFCIITSGLVDSTLLNLMYNMYTCSKVHLFPVYNVFTWLVRGRLENFNIVTNKIFIPVISVSLRVFLSFCI